MHPYPSSPYQAKINDLEDEVERLHSIIDVRDALISKTVDAAVKVEALIDAALVAMNKGNIGSAEIMLKMAIQANRHEL